MGLSSNSVIHFTPNISNLKGILKNGFDIRYCRETFLSKSKKRDLLVPMVSFCDTPFSQIIEHIKSYGSYGIGLSKNWAESKGLNPVLYLEKNSTLSENILSQLYLKIKGNKRSILDLSEKDRQVFDVLRYIKNYQGDLKRTEKKIITNYRFSDEREWRYVLDTKIKHLIFGNIPNSWDEKNIQLAKISENKKIEKHKLTFSPEDISYIIIKNENQRDGVIQTLEKVNGKHAHQAVKRLTSRIISTEQLITDF
ncbi:abortive infection system antitoxin AbiGi family protein [Psychroserpens sp.]